MKRFSSAFTLIELIVVLVILSMIIALFITNPFKALKKAKRDIAIMQMQEIKKGLKMFYLDIGRYPTTEEGLNALIHKPEDVDEDKWHKYLDKDTPPKDPWGHDYIYTSPLEEGPGFELKSLGADGKEGGKGDNKDIIIREVE